MSKIIDIMYVTGVPRNLKGIFIQFNGKIDTFLEESILNLIKEGWEVYGDVKETKVPGISCLFLQTMVKYQQKVTCEHCGKVFDSHDMMISSHLVDSADNSKKVCPATVSLF